MKLLGLAALAAALAVSGVVVATYLRDRGRETPETPRGAAASAPDAGAALHSAAISDSALVVGPAGAAPGRVRVAADPFRFEVGASAYRLGPDGLVLEGVTVRNATTAAAFEVRLYLIGPGLPPGGERAPIGDLAADETKGPDDLAFPLAVGAALAEPLRFYIAYRVAADEPTWLLSSPLAITLRTGAGG